MITQEELKELEHAVMKYLTTRRGCKHYRTFELMYALIEKYKFDPNKFSIKGLGWDRPADSSQPSNQALNRRVEISVFPPEKN